MRRVRPPSWKYGLPLGRRALVGSREEAVARRTRQTDSAQLPALWLWKGTIRTTRVVLACSHLDHDPTNNRPSNLKAFCQRCHMLHDRPEHQRRRWFTLFRRRALGDLYQGRYQ